jgi:signal transduction histidine kinase
MKKIIEQHKGRLWVESTSGMGAIFNFFLPKHQSRMNRLASSN